MLTFLVDYLWKLLCSWWTIAGLVWGIVDMTASHIKKVEWFKDTVLHKHRWRIALGLLIVGQMEAYRELLDQHTSAAAAPITVNANITGVSDMEARANLTKTREELNATKAALAESRKRIGELDPLLQPIASASISVAVSIPSDIRKMNDYLGDGAVAYLMLGKEVMIGGSIGQHYTDGKGNIRFAFECNQNSPQIGKPIKSLAEAEYILVGFKQTFVPLNTEVVSGEVIIVINNQVRLRFVVPKQTLSEQAPIGEMATLMFIRDIKDGLKPLATPPSPTTPQTGASGPKPTS